MKRSHVLIVLITLLLSAVSLGSVSALEPFPPAYLIDFTGGAYPTAINNNGQIAGWQSVNNVQEAWVYTPGAGLQILPQPPGLLHAKANDINDAGLVVGSASDGLSGAGQAIQWTPNGNGYVAEILDALPGFSISAATAVNNLGDIVGSSTGSSTILGSRATWFNAPGDPLDLGALGFSATPADINDQRQIVGNQLRMDLDSGFIEDLGVPTNAGTSYQWTTAVAINDSGQVASTGFLATSLDDNQTVVRYTDGAGWQVLSGPGKYNVASGINDDGDVSMSIVRYCYTSGYSDYRPSVYFEGQGNYCLQDLLAESERDWLLSNKAGGLSDINNAAQVAVLASNSSANLYGAALLQPDGLLPPPPAASNLAAVPHEATWQQPWNAITLTWSDNSQSELGFKIERRVSGAADWAQIKVLGIGAQMYWDTSVELGVTYDYRVLAYGLGGDAAPSNVATATAPATPIDQEPPVVSFVTPNEGDQISGNVQIVVDASDNRGLNYMDLDFSPHMGDSQICSASPGGALSYTLTCTWNTRDIAPGIYTLAAYASDAIGNYTTETISVQVGSTANPTLRSSAIDMSAKVRRGIVNVTGKVYVVDQDGAAVRSAIVTATWELPDGSTNSRTAYSNRKGVAQFSASGDRGTYTLTVTNITKSGYDFDATSGVLSNSITK